jgi:hypothetical protein
VFALIVTGLSQSMECLSPEPDDSNRNPLSKSESCLKPDWKTEATLKCDLDCTCLASATDSSAARYIHRKEAGYLYFGYTLTINFLFLFFPT